MAAVLGILFFLWWFVGLLRKARFRPGAAIVRERGQRRETELLRGSWVLRWVVPYLPERRTLWGLVFKAGSTRSFVLLAKESQAEDMRIGGQPIDAPGQKDLRISSGEAVQTTGRNRESFRYIVE